MSNQLFSPEIKDEAVARSRTADIRLQRFPSASVFPHTAYTSG